MRPPTSGPGDDAPATSPVGEVLRRSVGLAAQPLETGRFSEPLSLPDHNLPHCINGRFDILVVDPEVGHSSEASPSTAVQKDTAVR